MDMKKRSLAILFRVRLMALQRYSRPQAGSFLTRHKIVKRPVGFRALYSWVPFAWSTFAPWPK